MAEPAAPAAPPAPEEAEVKRGVGTGEQLPMGEATQVNESLETLPQLDQTGILQGVEWADGTEETNFVPTNEDDEILFGPAEGIGSGDNEPTPNRVPASVIRRLPVLARAAKDPTAPPSLVAMYRILTDRLDREMRR